MTWAMPARVLIPLDPDGDGITGEADTCPLVANIGDADNDGIDDACDSRPGITNTGDTDERRH